jgi:fused signal recognition particle receptor
MPVDTIREEQYSRMRLFGALKNIARKLTGKTVLDEDTAEELEEALIGADVAYETVTKILQRLHDSKAHPEGVEAGLREIICELMGADGPQGLVYGPQPPTVIFVAGVNGVGKTTTIAKLAHLYRREGKRVLLCAADTFRAAAIEQLEIWAGRVGADIVKGQPGADPADVVIVDTAGRLHTKSNLMEELRKIVRTVEKTAGRPPDETLLVLDATTGQNAIAQAREFLNAINVTGLVLSKMDSSARGGTVLSIRDELGVPVRYIGTGEKVEDLELFDPREFARQLLEG